MERQMKKHLLAATAFLALAGPAMAFGSNGTIMPNDPSIDTENLASVDAVMLECYPPIDRSDRDPVQRTNIDLTFKPGVSDQHVATLDVRHTLFSNRVIDRNTQYAGNVWKRSGYNEWYWGGPQYQNPRVSMQGTVFRTARGQWRYQEVVSKDDRVDNVIAPMNCTRTWGD
jgi:hypothetical protein